MKRDEEILEEFIAEQSINFAEFCAKEFCPTIQNGLVHWTKETYQTNDKIYTTKEVYEIFNSNNK